MNAQRPHFFARFSASPPVGPPGGLIALLSAVVAVVHGAEFGALTRDQRVVQFAFSKSLFKDVNENDSRAALKVCAPSIANDNGINVDGVPMLVDVTNAMARALGLGQIDLLSLASSDFFALESLGLEGSSLRTMIHQAFTMGPSATCFHRDLPEGMRWRIIRATQEGFGKPALDQLMALFKTQHLNSRPVSALEDTRTFMVRHQELHTTTHAPAADVRLSAGTEEGGSTR